MTEQPDKSPQKAGRTPPRRRPGKSPPAAKRSKLSPGRPGGEIPAKERESAAPAKAGESAPVRMTDASPLAPDPATIVFGSNRPIAAPPPKLPESSGLRFSGPSAGILKASGPQPTSPKAAGVTFTAVKAAPAKPAAKPAAKTAEAKRPAPGRGEPESAETRKPLPTKPAIAPQASGRHFDKERSASGFVLAMLALTVFGSGFAFWMKLSGEPTAPQEMASDAPARLQASPEVHAPQAPRSNGLPGGLSIAELREIQDLLSRLDFDPGSDPGVLTAATTAAIRSYQEMAGLPTDGEASLGLLEELRSVAALYGS